MSDKPEFVILEANPVGDSWFKDRFLASETDRTHDDNQLCGPDGKPRHSTYSDMPGISPGYTRPSEEIQEAISIVNWNRCVERAAKIAEESYLATEHVGFEKYQSVRQKHGACIASKIRELTLEKGVNI